MAEDIGTLIRAPLKSGILTGKFTTNTVFEPTDHRGNWLKGALLERAVREADALMEIVAPMPPAEAALRFILNQDAVSTVIPGAKNVAQVDSNCAAGDGEGLPPTWTRRSARPCPATSNAGPDGGYSSSSTPGSPHMIDHVREGFPAHPSARM